MCQQRPSPNAFLINWKESNAPLHKKLAMLIKNNWIKLRTAKSCCGHPGEVGC